MVKYPDYSSLYSKAANVTATLMTDDHIEGYGDYMRRTNDAEFLQGLLQGGDPEDPQVWRSHFSRLEGAGLTHFVLQKEGQIIGATALMFHNGSAVFTGSLIDPDFRGLGLADQLYDVRKRYLAETGYDGPAPETHIYEENGASRRAALRNGFSPAGRAEGRAQVFILK